MSDTKSMSNFGRLLIHTAMVDAAFGTKISGNESFEKATKMLRKATEMGDPAAAYELGCIYAKGVGGFTGDVVVPVDYVGALSLFRMASKLSSADTDGYPLAEAALMAGDMLYEGKGVSGEADLAFYKKEAFRYYKLSAEAGNVQAINNAAIMTEEKGDEFQVRACESQSDEQ